MASIQVRKDKKKSYRVLWRDINTRKQRSKSFMRRKDAQVFIESMRSSENLITRSDPNATVSDALNRRIVGPIDGAKGVTERLV